MGRMIYVVIDRACEVRMDQANYANSGFNFWAIDIASNRYSNN